MKTTYYIENLDRQVLSYFGRLTDAKEWAKDLRYPFRIVKLVGPYRYEGRHDRILEFSNSRYKVVKG